MKLKIKQNILMEHLNYAIKGISNKNIRPILNCIKFELTEDGLYLTSTDNDITIKTFIDKKNIEDIDTLGEIVVSGRYIYDIVKKLPNDFINIESVMDSKIYITTTNSSFYLNCNNVSEFPIIDFEESEEPIIIKNSIFKSAINQTAFASSTQESRPVLTGINFKIEDDILEFTATDSYRLAKKKINLDKKLSQSINIIVPTKNLVELVRMISDDEDNMVIHIFNNKIIFKFNTITLMSRLINGNYPDTSKLIPDEFEVKLLVNLNEFYNSIDRASLLTNEADKNTVRLESNDNIVVLSSNIPEIGNVEEKIEVKNINKKDIKISFSSKYIMDALRSLDCEEIELLFNSDIKPIIIKNPETDNLIQLVLPIRTY